MHPSWLNKVQTMCLWKSGSPETARIFSGSEWISFSRPNLWPQQETPRAAELYLFVKSSDMAIVSSASTRSAATPDVEPDGKVYSVYCKWIWRVRLTIHKLHLLSLLHKTHTNKYIISFEVISQSAYCNTLLHCPFSEILLIEDCLQMM